MFCFDLETLGTESSSVILSYAIVHFNPEDRPSYQQLLDKTLFVKINAADQIQRYKRTSSKDTMEWWSKQPRHTQDISLIPSKKDVSPLEAYQILYDYICRVPNAYEQTIWQRGSMDQLVIDSFCKSVDKNPIVRYTNWRDVRTAIDILYGTNNGYCEVDHPEFNQDLVVHHHPAHDVCFDVMMLLYGKQNV